MSLDPQAAAELFVEVFDRVHREQMAGLPLLNDRLQVETLGFRVFEGRMIGILITPWLMNVVMMPGENDDWSSDELGHKIPQRFPAGTYKFMVNEIEGIGRYLTHSLYSPMREFSSQNHALAAAESWLRTAMDPAQADQRDPIDEELLGRVMRGKKPRTSTSTNSSRLHLGRATQWRRHGYVACRVSACGSRRRAFPGATCCVAVSGVTPLTRQGERRRDPSLQWVGTIVRAVVLFAESPCASSLRRAQQGIQQVARRIVDHAYSGTLVDVDEQTIGAFAAARCQSFDQ